MKTELLRCTCEHPYQDTIYGKEIRVHNLVAAAKSVMLIWRCTVCQSERAKGVK
jgi:hypothetical protein